MSTFQTQAFAIMVNWLQGLKDHENRGVQGNIPWFRTIGHFNHGRDGGANQLTNPRRNNRIAFIPQTPANAADECSNSSFVHSMPTLHCWSHFCTPGTFQQCTRPSVSPLSKGGVPNHPLYQAKTAF